MRSYWLIGIGMLFVVLGTACEKSSQQPPAPAVPAAPAAPAAALPANLLVSTEPADAKDVVACKAAVKEGDPIVIRGRVGGAVDPFVAGRSVFTIVEKSLPHCGEMAMADSCKTPWDYCCEPKDKLAENTATIQVVGADGRPLKADLSTVPGLKGTAEVVVKGTVAKREGNKLLVVNAAELFIRK